MTIVGAIIGFYLTHILLDYMAGRFESITGLVLSMIKTRPWLSPWFQIVCGIIALFVNLLLGPFYVYIFEVLNKDKLMLLSTMKLALCYSAGMAIFLMWASIYIILFSRAVSENLLAAFASLSILLSSAYLFMGATYSLDDNEEH